MRKRMKTMSFLTLHNVRYCDMHNREFKTTTATATGTSLNKRFDEQNNGCARALRPG